MCGYSGTSAITGQGPIGPIWRSDTVLDGLQEQSYNRSHQHWC